MTDTTLHELCKGFGALLSRSKQPAFLEEASRLNDRGNLPLHAACSFQAGQEVLDALLKAYPNGASQPNNVGNLPIHQAAMWQAPIESVELLLSRYPEAATVRNQYGSLPLHMAASNQAVPEVVRLLIDSYPDALHLQNDDGMTPLDLALADESASETVVAMLEGRPPPPEMSRRQKADKFTERAEALERKLGGLRDQGGRQHRDLREAIQAVRRLADRCPHALYSAGMDPNELEIALGNTIPEEDGIVGFNSKDVKDESEYVILDAVKKRISEKLRKQRYASTSGTREGTSITTRDEVVSRDRVEDLLTSLVGLDHIKSQVRGLRRSTEIADLRESLIPHQNIPQSRGGPNMSLIPPALGDDINRLYASNMIFVGNPGVGKTSVARLLAKCYHELGILQKPFFLEVERMDLVGRNSQQTIAKTREAIDEARNGILFVDEAYTLSMPTKRSSADAGIDAIQELIKSIDVANENNNDTSPLIILAGFPQEMQNFLASQGSLRKRFPLTYEFPDYTCQELARIFIDLAHTKGFYLEDFLTVESIGNLLEQETTPSWRSERNGRVCELLLAGARTKVRKRMRKATHDEQDVDPHLIIRTDIENVVKDEFK